MLRITIHDRAPMTSFVLEGKLVGPWVKELKSAGKTRWLMILLFRCWSIWPLSPSSITTGERC